MSTSGLLIAPLWCLWLLPGWPECLTWAGGHGGRERGESCSHVLLFPKQGACNGQQQDLPTQLHPIMIRLWAGKRTGSAGIIPSWWVAAVPLSPWPSCLLPSRSDNGLRMQFLLTLHNQKCLFVCVIVYLSHCLFFTLFVCPIVYLSHSWFVPLFIFPLSLLVPFFIYSIVYLSLSLFVPFFICPILYLSHCLFVPLFVCPTPYPDKWLT